jgi:hypothetical protein
MEGIIFFPSSYLSVYLFFIPLHRSIFSTVFIMTTSNPNTAEQRAREHIKQMNVEKYGHFSNDDDDGGDRPRFSVAYSTRCRASSSSYHKVNRGRNDRKCATDEKNICLMYTSILRRTDCLEVISNYAAHMCGSDGVVVVFVLRCLHLLLLIRFPDCMRRAEQKKSIYHQK